MNAVQRYNKVSIILHWLIGIVLLCMFALGFWMSDLPKDLPKSATLDLFNLGVHTMTFAEPLSPRAFYFNLHKSIGVTLLVLIVFRLLWRLSHPAPELLPTMKAWEKKLSEVTHKVLYLLMLAMPISGLIMTLYSKYGVVWFGIPLMKGIDNPELRDVFKESHEVIGIIFLVLVILHILAAIKHKVIDKDDVMKRMSLH
jgi:cytochrome b561